MTYINRTIASVYIFTVSKRVIEKNIESIAQLFWNYFIQIEDIMSAENFWVEIQIFQKNYQIWVHLSAWMHTFFVHNIQNPNVIFIVKKILLNEKYLQ